MHRPWLRPDWDPGLTLAHLPLEPLLGRGIRVMLLDVDRTLLPGRDVELPDAMQRWVNVATRHLHLHLSSNNPSRARVQAVAQQMKVSFTCAASKPRRGAILQVMNQLSHPPAQIAMVGDRQQRVRRRGNRTNPRWEFHAPSCRTHPNVDSCEVVRTWKAHTNEGAFACALAIVFVQ